MSKANQIDKALVFIEDNLRKTISLEEIADVANYSPWHFHRLFNASTGITVGEYIRKRRLSEASRELIFTDRPIKQIAADYQFESQAAFTRSFKAFSGCTPGKVRASLRSLTSFEPLRIRTSRGKTMQTPKIVHRNTTRVFGISCHSTMNNNVIPALWEEFFKICKKIPNPLYEETALGVCYSISDDPTTPDTPFGYLAGVEVSAAETLPEGMEEITVPEGDYAVFEHIGALDNLHNTYNAIYGEWLPASGYEQSGDLDFELYGPHFRYGTAESVLEIWIPVKKK